MVCLPRALPPAAGPGRYVRLTLLRGPGPDFSERDRAVLTLLGPHLDEAYLDAERRRRPVPPAHPPSFIGPVAPHSGGTLILSGSPRLLIQHERQLPASQRGGSIATLRDRFHRSHPWLMALTGQAPSPADRIAAFMDRETTVDGVPLGVVELTGEPGDMVFCHPVMVHCVAPNRGTRPRFMRIKTQVLTHEGREQRNRQQRLPS